MGRSCVGERGAIVAVVCGALCLGGCFSSNGIREGSRPSIRSSSTVEIGAGQYRVERGDTLYSIAFRRQLDFHELAAWNRIAAPAYVIYPGQVLRLTPSGQAGQSGPAAELATRGTLSPATATIEQSSIAAPTAVARSTPGFGPGSAALTTAPRAAPPVVLPPDSAKLPRTRSSTVASPSIGPQFDTGRWEWPTHGTVVRNFGIDGSKGIDIGGKLGQIVLAAAPGKVVYSGSALKGYGELIIIKHDEQYLSAYGYNSRRLVEEGDSVVSGQPIAELGDGPQQQPELHFEIRERGQPVNPLPLLPRHP